MNVPVYSSHNSALSLWQSAIHSVLTQKPAQQNSGHQGIGVTALVPEMLATARVVDHFDQTGNFDLPAQNTGLARRRRRQAAPRQFRSNAPGSPPRSPSIL